MPKVDVVEITGIDELLARIDRLASPAVLLKGMRKATSLVRRKLSTYPPAAHRPMVWASEKQRRFVLAAIREGRIQVPYRRTGTLSRRWTSVEVVASGRDIEGRIGNNATYGPFVMGKETQAAYHVGVWPVAADVVEDQRAEIVQCFQDTLDEALRS